MKLIAIFLIGVAITVSAASRSQTITLEASNMPLEKVLKVITQQSRYFVLYKLNTVEASAPITISVKNEPVTSFLDKVLKDQQLTYTIEGNTIALKRKLIPIVPSALSNGEGLGLPDFIPITGRVLDESGKPVAGVNIEVKGARSGTRTNTDGSFTLNADPGDLLLFSCVGYEPQTLKADKGRLVVIMKLSVSELDENIVIAYGNTTRRLNTGSVTKVSAEEIAKQPVTNPLGALMGRVPGMKITQQDGLAGGFFDVIIRGRNSLVQGYRPLILLDGVPITNESMSNAFPGTNSYNSPLNLINPANIESIEVLKDADATSIYGSRGSNGVILITTKKGKAGKTEVDINAYRGITRSTVTAQLLNTEQYLEMRREAFKNDNITPNLSTAPDLLVWDTKRYTNWNELFYSGHAASSDVQLGLTGGSASTNFRLGFGYHHDTPLYADLAKSLGKRFGYDRGSVMLNVTHKSADNKLNISVSTGYSTDRTRYSGYTPPNIFLPPNAPYPLDANNELVWSEGGVSFANPIAPMFNPYNANNKNINSNLVISYQLLKGLQAKVSGGYNSIAYSDMVLTTKKGQTPFLTQRSSARMNMNTIASWMLEPMIQYNTVAGPGKMEVLLGQTWQAKNTNITRIAVNDYQSETYLGTTSGATSITTTIQKTDYYYEGVFGKINYNIDNKYLLNITARRDGSSRFGPGKRYSNFGAAGFAYIFSEEKAVKRALPFLSFGKLRANIGVTGNDNIGDYKYFENWTAQSSSYVYAGSTGLVVSGIYNSDYSWEKNVKTEAALELGFLGNRILLNVNYYKSKAGNQLVNYKLPSQVGSSSVLKNFEAVILNYGWEMTLSASPIQKKFFRWHISANTTIARNKLAAFPNLESSSYSTRYIINEPITIQKYFHYLGLDPQTGLYTFSGTAAKDRTVLKDDNTPFFYGGITNSFSYKGLELEVFSQFLCQNRQSFLLGLSSAPGTMNNQPAAVLNRWQKPGDITDLQRFTTTGTATSTFTWLKQSDAYMVNGAFLRIKNVSLSYTLAPKILKVLHLKKLRAYLQGQNLAIISSYKGADPETAGIGNPLTKAYTAGIQLTL